ncbi:MAG: TetR/AcrR family transcriptional regulator [Myxococcota bacterium]
MNDFEPRKKPKQARSRATFEAIVEAGAQLLVEDGYHDLTTNGLAERAGVSIGSLYQYFPNKEAVVASVVERFADRQFDILVAGLDELAGAPTEDVVRHLVERMLEAKRAEPELSRVLLQELPQIGQVDVLRDWTQRASELVEFALEARRDELGVEDLHMAAFMAVTACHGVVQCTLLDRPELLEDESLTEHTTRLMLTYLGVGT